MSNPARALLQDLSTLPDSVRVQVASACGATSADEASLPNVCGHHVEMTEELVIVSVVCANALVRTQMARQGAVQHTVIPLTRVIRHEEIFDGQRLEVVIELEADVTTLSLVGAQVDARMELQGQMLRNGWVMLAEGPQLARLAAFSLALRQQIHASH